MSATGQTGDVDDAGLAQAYAAEPAADGLWVRVNMIASLDGSAQGEDGVTDGINNAADKRVFHALRSYADVVVVGAGTARAENYGPADGTPLVVVSRTGEINEKLLAAPRGSVILATVEHAAGLPAARAALGDENVMILGGYSIDFTALRRELAARGWTQVLGEGGPHVLRDLLAVDVVDELCLTIVPRVVAGDHLRIVEGQPIDVAMDPVLLLEEEGTLIGRWRVRR
ncbi:dihydrofolate reductase family protein [Nocardioides sp. Y6]|uniref:Dihydrofolate reductase family protein n=1 Tax=Nocardioides malaquae TaxID=2773426 RepID=A0ABR9RUB2_9ACTN|nr:dihydrofolate reductase family protein [Nocardioides malaquae]MBE7324782.1 dihydrofolate reductase family protein [Nocardioides malaquae]